MKKIGNTAVLLSIACLFVVWIDRSLVCGLLFAISLSTMLLSSNNIYRLYFYYFSISTGLTSPHLLRKKFNWQKCIATGRYISQRE
mmetsp:Transcript_33/g.70  ORF Transcript_33/g.70 Transcript_33/m.70 type:complete len:86 (+) Transcript_33:174-431(+)